MKGYYQLLTILAMLFNGLHAYAQYPPAVGHPGTTAIFKDSSVFVAWASGCTVNRGWQDISDHGLGYTNVGDSSMATGAAGTNGVVSLGDGGIADLTFDLPIVNGPSWDFAVFENSFDDYFLELAFVEVSSDGAEYFCFPSASLTDTSTQVDSFDSLDATKINNLAGKYRGMYGTPFDLEELKNEPGLDVNHITHIRVRDVVGSLQAAYATHDFSGRKINDPWPTAFPSGGFDLDAAGVIWNTANAVPEFSLSEENVMVYPNPAGDHFNVRWTGRANPEGMISILDVTGKCLTEAAVKAGEKDSMMRSEGLAAGVYILHCRSDEHIITKKLIIR